MRKRMAGQNPDSAEWYIFNTPLISLINLLQPGNEGGVECVFQKPDAAFQLTKDED